MNLAGDLNLMAKPFKLIAKLAKAHKPIVTFMLIVVVITFAGMAWLTFWLPEPSKTGYKWIQLATGSSWPDIENLMQHPKSFVAAASLHVLLNIAPLIGVIWGVIELFRFERRIVVKLADALKLRDQTMINQLIDDFDLDEAKLETSVLTAAGRWEKYQLPIVVGPEHVDQSLSGTEDR